MTEHEASPRGAGTLHVENGKRRGFYSPRICCVNP